MAGGLEGHPYEDDISDSKDDSVGQLAPPFIFLAFLAIRLNAECEWTGDH